ncbi:staygreen family protein [Ectobacillus funiculus]|uniref:Staygreen family protein n=1 Tax=Ectobacillus funiculus TaxID=137993 RepID=A0ABV5W9V0_9BACI
MSNFDPTKLFVTFLPPANLYEPVINRKYTLTHSDVTEKLFLSIGYTYDTYAIDQHLRDELVAQWTNKHEKLVLFGKVYISGGEFDEKTAGKRFYIFQKEMAMALKAIVNGDKQLYTYFPSLLTAPIYIYFESVYPDFSRVVYYGMPKQYLHKSDKT